MTRSIITEIVQDNGSPFNMGSPFGVLQISDDIHTQRAFDETGHFQIVLSNALQVGDSALLFLVGRSTFTAKDSEIVVLDLSTFVAPALTEIVLNIQLYPIMRVALFTMVNPVLDPSTTIRCFLQQ